RTCHEIGRHIARQGADDGGDERDLERGEQDIAIKTVAEHQLPVVEIKARLIGAGGSAQPKRIQDHEAGRDEQKKGHHRQGRTQQQPRPAIPCYCSLLLHLLSSTLLPATLHGILVGATHAVAMNDSAYQAWFYAM